jgi:diaminohydroxyphosphoribosylaminopyrimidine deaminase/5-amino-6-(5-phosphoribosylamino)uracil reductase
VAFKDLAYIYEALNTDEKYMMRALALAEKGLGYVAPNPMVGCVIVQNGKIISEGYHEKFGEPHAEVNAITKLAPDFDFTDCTLYVNLEPCSHFGKTPPCADLIVSKRFKKVVVGNLDTNPLVSGKGIEKLKHATIQVEYGILDKECRELNKRFFTFHEKKRPYIILKWAQTADGFISRWPLPENKADNWITGEESKTLVHQWRSEEQAIMVGTNTVVNDDPELTVRLVKGKNPIRVVLDKDLRLSHNFHIYDGAAETLVFTGKTAEPSGHTKFITIDFSQNIILQVLSKLHELHISSMIVEGGAQLLQSFIDAGMWDEARVFANPDKRFENGIKSPLLRMNPEVSLVGKDLLYLFKRS